MKHWIENYLGIEWVAGGNTSNGLDCWGLFRRIQIEQFNRCMPMDRPKTTAGIRVELRNWQKADVPTHGSAVFFRINKNHPHIGTYVVTEYEAGVIHILNDCSVMFTELFKLRNYRWEIMAYYEYNQLSV